MRPTGISWMGLKTTSYEAMKAFFAETLGLPIAFEKHDFSVFRLPNGDKVEVFGPAAGEPQEQFAVNQVVTGLLVEDIDEATIRLRAAGLELLGERQVGGDGYFWQHFRAPDGKVLELVCDPSHT
jgi:predicted enzyme related to lactoylglutathione lyase